MIMQPNYVGNKHVSLNIMKPRIFKKNGQGETYRECIRGFNLTAGRRMTDQVTKLSL